MKIQPTAGKRTILQQTRRHLLKGDIVKPASNQVDKFDKVNDRDARKSHRASSRYDKQLGMNVMHIIDNRTGETVKQSHSDARIDHMIRMRRLMGLNIDEEG